MVSYPDGRCSTCFRYTTPRLPLLLVTIGQSSINQHIVSCPSRLSVETSGEPLGTSVGALHQANLMFGVDVVDVVVCVESAPGIHTPGILNARIPPNFWCKAPHLHHVFVMNSSVSTNTLFHIFSAVRIDISLSWVASTQR